MDLPRYVGSTANVGSGISLNFIGMAMDRISLVFFTIALVMSLNDAAGPYSVPPMLSTMSFEMDFT